MHNTADIPDLSCKAWLLPTGAGTVAIGEYELIYVIAGWQRYMPVPRSPRWCRHVFLWQNHLLPLFDLEIYINPEQRNTDQNTSGSRDIVAVIAYENKQNEICYGGLKLGAPPSVRVVNNDEICDYPANYPDWDRIALSCIRDQDAGPVPILDIQKIFCPVKK
jgi:chemotaxis signal transduction protein